ncbi:hypothetical protein SEA_ADNAMA_7 [Mycobacterium phage Adnama]|uniref:Membrane protein n=1 Tax=Mycobacterium Phage Xandras TaxID=3158891 RepID=A0AAU8GN09_9CAUD|nr:hypothetical protein SEA_RAKIM_7 [Mycobacterium phage Rakim]AOY11860.1 membrane domain protein [Mycobacterium phage Goldilocks]AVE00052.1 hypothetical protein SEA_KIMCHI_7 [Mycobacterium phage Kimchi]AVI03902.1 hypothetical protein SEA_GAGE_7 [Mycobacterium phage Gage]AXC35850.1 hypothetical protein SEA_ADNAMA_7 [Mycobacterium phage Adnama]AYB70220.1 hypothetical protein SEA_PAPERBEATSROCK_7 [Mycobacterium phage Paperbeatsrock]AYD83718.1 hypothetical protein SEA_GEMINI_7 [Mycobacterium pha
MVNRDFWLGMLALPAAAAAIALTVGVVAGVIWYSERFSLGTWRLWPRSTRGREVLPAIAACAKWTRYLWIPGWHVIICRTTLYDPYDVADNDKHYLVRNAIREALRRAGEHDSD